MGQLESEYQFYSMQSVGESTALQQVYKMSQKLHAAIDEMDEKISEAIRSHEAQFMYAYRNHIRKMRSQLTAIRQRTDQQDKHMLSDNRGIFQEKQLKLFREEALQLYDRLGESTHCADILRNKLAEMERMNSLTERQNKILIRDLKIGQIKQGNSEQKVKQLQKQVQLLKQVLSGQPSKKQEGATFSRGVESSVPRMRAASNSLRLNSIAQKSRRVKRRELLGKTITSGENELQNWFLDCIYTIKKEVAQRKNHSPGTLRLEDVVSFSEFKMIDKLKLLEIFLQNEKFLVWMYSKIFPDRHAQLSNFLTQNPIALPERKASEQSEQQDSSHYSKLTDSHSLKVQAIKREVQTIQKVSLRERVVMRKGKLMIDG